MYMKFCQRLIFRTNPLAALVIVAVSVGASVACAAECDSYQSFPLLVRIDDTYAPSSMYLSCSTVESGLPFDEFKAAASAPDDEMFVALVDALFSGDLDTVNTLASPRANPAAIAGFMRMAEKLSGMKTVVRKLKLGEDTVFIWNAEKGDPPEGKISQWFRFVPDEQGAMLWDGGEQNVLVRMLSHAFQYAIDHPGEYQVASPSSRPIRRPLGVYTSGCPVYVEFAGELAGGFDALAGSTGAPNTLLQFYSGVWRSITNGDLEAQAVYYTPQSAEKYQGWVDSMDETRRNAYLSDIMLAGKDVMFVLQAEPAMVVFTRPRTADKPSLLKHELIYVDPETEKMNLASFYYESFLDKFLRDEELFVKPVLLPILEKGLTAETHEAVP